MDVQFRLDYLSNDESEHLFYPLVITEKEMTGGFFYGKRTNDLCG